MGTKNNPGPCDCYAKADPDEPIFVLLGRDKHASALVWLWAFLREDDPSAEEAKACAEAMRLWCRSKGRHPVSIARAVLVGAMALAVAVGTLESVDANETLLASCGLKPDNAARERRRLLIAGLRKQGDAHDRAADEFEWKSPRWTELKSRAAECFDAANMLEGK